MASLGTVWSEQDVDGNLLTREITKCLRRLARIGTGVLVVIGTRLRTIF
jgi:hypothetical protein